MKNCFLLIAFISLCVIVSCNNASTDSTSGNGNKFPTYKYSFTGNISNPKNITIPEDAYFVGVWIVSSGSPDYLYYYGDGYIDKSNNTFTFGFKDTLPPDAVNRSANDPGSFSVGYMLLVTSKNKVSGKELNRESASIDSAKIWGALNWAGIVYVGADSTVAWKDWTKAFKPGYTYAEGVTNGGDYFVEANKNNMKVMIDTSRDAFDFPDWTGINPDKANSK